MTKFILVGGYIKKAPDGGKAFCEELVKGIAEPVKILDCMFARTQDRWQESFEADKELFSNNLPHVTVDLQLAEYDSFVEQVQWADAVFLRGGFSEQLVSALEERADWKKYLKGKTVAGTSAGADAISTYYFGLDTKEVRSGVGLLPVKVIPHFKSDYNGWEFDWDKAYSELESYKESLSMYALGEGEFKVIESE